MKDVNGTGMKRAALLNDYSCFGKCSLSVSVPILSSYGVEAVALPTALLSTHTGGFDGYVVRDLTGEMKQFAEHWKKLHLKFDCIYTGFFLSVEQIEFVKQFIRDFAGPDTRILVDPVLGDNGSLYGCFTPDFIPAMRELAEMADIITPNRTEAALLTGLPLSTDDETLLRALPASEAVITSIENGGSIGYLARLKAGDLLRVEKEKGRYHAAWCGRCVRIQPLRRAAQRSGYADGACTRGSVLRRLHPRNTAAPAGPLVRSGI